MAAKSVSPAPREKAARSGFPPPSRPHRSMRRRHGRARAQFGNAHGGRAAPAGGGGQPDQSGSRDAATRDLGYRVDVAANGREALERVGSARYDLILGHADAADGRPRRDPRDRALPGDTGAMPIIAMTANAFAEDRARCLAAGMNDHIAKPVDLSTLEAMVARWLAAASPAAARWHRGAGSQLLPRTRRCAGAAGNRCDRGCIWPAIVPSVTPRCCGCLPNSMLARPANCRPRWMLRARAGRASCALAQGFVGDDRADALAAAAAGLELAIRNGARQRAGRRTSGRGGAVKRCVARRSNLLWPIDSPLHSAAALRRHCLFAGAVDGGAPNESPLHERCTVLRRACDAAPRDADLRRRPTGHAWVVGKHALRSVGPRPIEDDAVQAAGELHDANFVPPALEFRLEASSSVPFSR